MHNDYSLAPENIEIKESMLSNYCKEVASKYNASVGGVKKFAPSFGNKNTNVLEGWNLQLYLQ